MLFRSLLPQDPSQPREKPQPQVQVHPAQLPGEGGLQPPGCSSRGRRAGRRGGSRCPAGPAAAALPPPPVSRRGLAHLDFARVSAAAGGVQTWTLITEARPRLPHASGASDASRCGGGEGPGPQESSRKPAGSAGPGATNASPSPPGARASPLPPTRASCQAPAAQPRLQSISRPMPRLAGHRPGKETVTLCPR